MKQIGMFGSKWLLVFFLLAALPALACSTILGSDEDTANADVAEATTVVDEAVQAETEITQEPTQEAETPPTEQPESTPTAEPTEVPTEVSGEAGESVEGGSLAEIIAAQRSGLEVDALRIHMISEDSATGLTSETTFELVKPDRLRMSNEEFELIVIGDTTYIKDESGTWLESPIPMGDMFAETLSSFTDEEAVNEMIEDLQVSVSDLQMLGEETVNGRETKVYQYSSTNSLDSSIVFSTVWIGVDDGLLYRHEMEIDSTDNQGSLTFEYEYGENVSIEAPIP